MTDETDDDGPNISEDALKAISRAASGRWSDAGPLMAQVASESNRTHCWRPARAGLLVGSWDGPAIWMTLDQMENWITVHKMRSPAKRSAVTDIGGRRLKSIRAGSEISRIEALACAHYALGLEQPVPTGDVNAFAIWAGERFGAFTAVARWLNTTGWMITDRIRGHHMRQGVRVARAPEASLIRALDYIWQVGPSCPYGDRPGVAYWPGQGTLP